MADIYFRCLCGKDLAVEEAAAGETLDCPECGNPILIPHPVIRWKCSCGEEMSAGEDMGREEVACAKCGAGSSVPSRFRLKKIGQAQDEQDANEPSRPCPSCGSMMKKDAVLCIECGFNLKTGKRIKTRFDSRGGRGKKSAVLLIAVCVIAAGVWGYRTSMRPMLLENRFNHVCAACEGQGRCPECRGYGRIRCDACGGTGLGEMKAEERRCTRCRGQGSVALLRGSVKCPDCGGTGKVSVQTRTMCETCEGKQHIACSACEETGRCRACDGQGLAKKRFLFF